MGRKLRHVLIFLLIILKEPNMPEADCSCKPSSHCKCIEKRLRCIPPNLPTSILYHSKILQAGTFANLPRLEALYLRNSTIRTIPSEPTVSPTTTTVTSHYHWFFTRNAGSTAIAENKSKTRATQNTPIAVTSNKPESVPSVPLPVLIGSVCGPVAGTVLISAIIFTVWYKIKSRRPPLGLNPNVVGGNTNTAVTVSVSNDDHEDTDKLGVQNGQGQANIQSLHVGNLSHNQVLAALKPNPMYAATGNAAVSVMASGDGYEYEDIDKPRVKTGQGQSQAIPESNTTPKATVMASGDDQTGQGQSQANTESDTNTTATVMASGHGRTGQSQYQPLIKANTNTTAVVMTNQARQGQYQAITESLDARNISYGTGPTTSQVNSVYKTATVMTSGQDQTGQGQS
ncbi:hypothetical protein Bbelb_350420 [Branchiostoma belcheri]|nr:hypothetical protein Bbelb_350420 [Branchiostoma belcheri]